MDPHAFLIRRRAELVALAVLAGRRALRAARAAARSSETPDVTIPAPALHALLRAAVPPGADKPTRKAHAELTAAMELACLRLLTIGDSGPADNQARAAVRLVARLCTRWEADQTRLGARNQARESALRARLSIIKLPPPLTNRSHSVPVPGNRAEPLTPPALSPIAAAAGTHWRRRTRIEQAALDLARERMLRMAGFAAPGSAHERADHARAARLATYTAAELAAARSLATAPPPPPAKEPQPCSTTTPAPIRAARRR